MKFICNQEEWRSFLNLTSPEKNDKGYESQKKIQKRNRKSMAQLRILLQEFKDPDSWDREKISMLAQKTGLSENQIYKWSWDQKKKPAFKKTLKKNNLKLCEMFGELPYVQNNRIIKHGTDFIEKKLTCEEVILPSNLDFQYHLIQINYQKNLNYILQKRFNRYLEVSFENLSARGFQ